jgi:hypothetical protein
MRGMRNIVAHDYGNVDPKIIWEVATIHIPEGCSVPEKFFCGTEVTSYSKGKSKQEQVWHIFFIR